METLKKIWSVIEKHRWSVILPLIGFMVWVWLAISCTPLTESPIKKGVMVNAVELEQDYYTWLTDCNMVAHKFEWAAADIQCQKEQWSKIESALMTIASGGVTDKVGLLQLIFGTGLIGFFADNVRKNGVIAGLKRNKTPT